MAANWVRSRQTKYAGYAAVYVVVILGVLAVVLERRRRRRIEKKQIDDFMEWESYPY